MSRTSVPNETIGRITAAIRGDDALDDVISIVSEIMPTDTRYNGWTNYETWAVGMYLDGNYTGEGTCREYERFFSNAADDVREEIEEGIPSDEATENALYPLVENLKANVEAEILNDDSLTSGIVGDLLGAALSEVDWSEIAKTKLKDEM